MYRLVADVNAYKEFLPYCTGAQVEPLGENKIKARVDFQHLGIKLSFTTLNRYTPYELIDMQLVEGPFDDLKGYWVFKPLGEGGCEIDLDIEFQVTNSVTGAAIQKLFELVSSKLVQAFVQRANDLHL